jgi:hypothetical protein
LKVLNNDGMTRRVREILATVKPLAAEYYQLTGKPLGVTGEVAECPAPFRKGAPPSSCAGKIAPRSPEASVAKIRSVL